MSLILSLLGLLADQAAFAADDPHDRSKLEGEWHFLSLKYKKERPTGTLSRSGGFCVLQNGKLLAVRSVPGLVVESERERQ